MTTTRLDLVMPTFDVREHHQASVNSTAERVYDAVRSMNLARSPIVMTLALIRGIPHLLTGKAAPTLELKLDHLLDLGFVVLEERAGEELVLGVVGKFWQLDSGIKRIDASEFGGFNEPGCAKAVMNFRIDEGPGTSVVVSTETRVVATDDAARRKFLLYWRLIGPFSGFIRTRFLAAIKREAEAHRTS